MIKKSISLLCMVTIVFGTMLTVNSQEESKEFMVETILLTPDNTKLKVLADNMRKHNATYHNEPGPYQATVYGISSGPNAGKLVWLMGPMTYAHNDTRPSEGGHDEDWRDNVMPYIKKMHTIEYWKHDNKLSNTSMLDGDDSKYPIVFVRYHEVEPGHGSSVNQHLKYVSETIKAMDGENPWGVYYNEFRQGDLGRHIATVGFIKNWAEFDKDNNFKKTFEKVHGKENWQAFLDMADRTYSNSWDEIWTYNAYMSGK